MQRLSLLRAILLGLVVAWGVPAHAQTAPTPQHLQALIASGQERAALGGLKGILRAHPDSGVAWYLVAEAQDASGNRPAARNALAKAEQYAPGLPFAQPAKVAALKAHIAGPAARRGSGASHIGIVIAVLVGLFLLIRLFLRSRRGVSQPGYQNGYGAGPGFPGGPPNSPYGPGGAMPYGPGVGMPQSGAGSSLLTGLAAGAGFAAGERIIGGLTDGSGARGIDQAPSNDSVPDRDDGLIGSPDWSNNTSGDSGASDNGGDFDPDNQW